MTDPDIERLLDQVEQALAATLRAADSKNGPTELKERMALGRSVSVNMSVKVGFLDELGFAGSTAPTAFANEPLIDAFEDGKALRVVVLLPGVKREDVRVLAADRSIRIEVARGDDVYYKEIPCGIAASRISARSFTENNSVIEILFEENEVRRR